MQILLLRDILNPIILPLKVNHVKQTFFKQLPFIIIAG